MKKNYLSPLLEIILLDVTSVLMDSNFVGVDDLTSTPWDKF